MGRASAFLYLMSGFCAVPVILAHDLTTAQYLAAVGFVLFWLILTAVWLSRANLRGEAHARAVPRDPPPSVRRIRRP